MTSKKKVSIQLTHPIGLVNITWKYGSPLVSSSARIGIDTQARTHLELPAGSSLPEEWFAAAREACSRSSRGCGTIFTLPSGNRVAVVFWYSHQEQLLLMTLPVPTEERSGALTHNVARAYGAGLGFGGDLLKLALGRGAGTSVSARE